MDVAGEGVVFTTWPEMESRLKALPLADCRRGEIEGLCSSFGLSSSGGANAVLVIGKLSRQIVALLVCVNLAIRGLPDYPPDFVYTSLQVGRNQLVKEHCDARNLGLSISFAVGGFSGGELIVEGIPFVTKEKVLSFDGRKLHSVAIFEGDRVSV
jgi:hypothetical protein